MLELIIAATSVGASAAAYGMGRIHGKEKAHNDANEWANERIRQFGAEDDLTRRIRETEDRMKLAEIHGHPNRFCTEDCYRR
jgi:hypothetical protein